MVFPNSYSLFTDISLSNVRSYDNSLNDTLIATLSSYNSTGDMTFDTSTYIPSLTTPDVSGLNSEIAENQSNYKRAISSLNQNFLDTMVDNNTSNNDDIVSYQEKQEEIEELKIINNTLEFRLSLANQQPSLFLFLTWSIIFLFLFYCLMLFLLDDEKDLNMPTKIILGLAFLYIVYKCIINIVDYYKY